jgi:uncharacterized membrane protein
MKTKIYLPALFLVMILCSGSLIVSNTVKSTDRQLTVSIDQAPAKVVPNLSSICVWDENTRSLVFNDNKMGSVISDKLPSGLPITLQIYAMLSTQIQCWIWEIQPRGITKYN